MSEAAALANLVLGVAYVVMGTIAAYELVAGWRLNGFSRFGAGLVAIAFTCGPHHLTHAVHIGIEGHAVDRLDLITVLVGLPPAVLWAALRIEALVGGRGDRFIAGTPGWLQSLPTAAGAYFTLVVVAGASVAADAGARVTPVAVLGGATAAVFFAIGWIIARTQVRNRAAVGGWSLSGVGIATIFATCGAMHMGLALQQLGGAEHADIHLVGVDAAAALAGIYFLTVVRRLTRDVLDDWNTVGTSPVPA